MRPRSKRCSNGAENSTVHLIGWPNPANKTAVLNLQRTGVPTVPGFLCVHRHGFSCRPQRLRYKILSHSSCTHTPLSGQFSGGAGGLNSQLNHLHPTSFTLCPLFLIRVLFTLFPLPSCTCICCPCHSAFEKGPARIETSGPLNFKSPSVRKKWSK